jgi:hypothetical protein
MLGARKQRCLERSVAVSLAALVPPDHFYRHLEAKLDLSFVREVVRDQYATIGRPSIDPVVFFKLQLILFVESIRSERKLLEVASLNLAHRRSGPSSRGEARLRCSARGRCRAAARAFPAQSWR